MSRQRRNRAELTKPPIQLQLRWEDYKSAPLCTKLHCHSDVRKLISSEIYMDYQIQHPDIQKFLKPLQRHGSLDPA